MIENKGTVISFKLNKIIQRIVSLRAHKTSISLNHVFIYVRWLLCHSYFIDTENRKMFSDFEKIKQ